MRAIFELWQNMAEVKTAALQPQHAQPSGFKDQLIADHRLHGLNNWQQCATDELEWNPVFTCFRKGLWHWLCGKVHVRNLEFFMNRTTTTRLNTLMLVEGQSMCDILYSMPCAVEILGKLVAQGKLWKWKMTLFRLKAVSNKAVEGCHYYFWWLWIPVMSISNSLTTLMMFGYYRKE